MKFSMRPIFAAFVLSLASISQPLLAANFLRIDYTGVITSVEVGPFTIGDEINGHFVFSLSPVITQIFPPGPGPWQANFFSQPSDLEIEGRTIGPIAGTFLSQVWWSGPLSFSSAPDAAGFSSRQFDSESSPLKQIEIEFTGYDLFDHAESPLDLFALDLGALHSATFEYQLGVSYATIFEKWGGNITSLSASIVPLPTAWLLLLPSLLVVGRAKRQ